MPACSGRKCPSSFEEGGRFVSSSHRRHRRGQPLSSPPFHRFGPCLPAPRLFVPRLPRCGCRLPLLLSPRLPRCGCLSLLLSPRLPRCGCPATAAFGYRGTARTATLPAWSEMPPRPVFLLQFCPEHHHPEAPHGPQPLPLGLKCRHGPRPFCSSARSTTTPKRRTACACSPALPGAPTRPALLLLFCPGRPQSAPRPPHPARRHGPRPFCCSARGPRPGSARGTKKADGTAQRPARRQKATNLSRQHHRGRSSGSPENRLF